MLLLEDARVVEEGTEVAAGDKVHREVDVGGVLEGVEEPDEPGSVGRGEDVPLGKDVADLE